MLQKNFDIFFYLLREGGLTPELQQCIYIGADLKSQYLLYLGREYPKGYDYFKKKCKAAFMKTKM
ncbi:hypothetical protein KUTeg_023849 [Tegillarca granosa]|uniref:Uncharacterized protein n=1 Tax=Tegillarca granosa TaxID=220873 RepID=A0ABQ9E644_TEGGR|nr:hypothetical protein KUTeg_023849 [Tegillarca granosa]